MSKISAKLTEEFFSPKKLAIIGVSRDPKKFSRMAYKELLGKGMDVYPVNPKLEEADGRKCYHDIGSLPTGIDRVIFMTPKNETASEVEKAIAGGFKYIWLQQGSETPEAIGIARQADVKLISKACVLMFAHPVKSIHGFHRFMSRLFGQISA